MRNLTTKNGKKEGASAKEAVKFTKRQVLSSKKYFHRRDLLNTLLDEGESYTLKEVDALVDKFMKGGVK